MIESLNRAFLYGESVFTTLRMVDGNLRDWDLHFERLRKGIEFVYGPFSDSENWARELKDRFEAYCQQETGDKVIRLTVYRHQARGLRPCGLLTVSDLKIHLSASAFDSTRSEGVSIKLRTCQAITKPMWWPEYLKTGNYLDVILAQKMFLKDEDDDLLFLSSEDTILESSVANIFIVRHNKLYTAPVGPNVLAGIMRRKVLEIADQYFDEVIEEETSMSQVVKADAVFGSNSVRGLFLVSAIDEHEFKYNKEFSEKFGKLKEQVLK